MNNTKKDLNKLGFVYSIGFVVIMAVQLLFSTILKTNTSVNNSFWVIMISVDIVGFPLIFLLTRKLNSWKHEGDTLGILYFIQGMFITYTFFVPGTYVGNIMTRIITGTQLDAMTEMILKSSNPVLRILVTAILAPIFEELIFRKLLIDHLAHRGKLLAMVTSALFFGLFHGNFAQCFFAALLGFFWAYVYIRTGRIIYTMLYHIMINTVSSTIGVWVIQKAGGMEVITNPSPDNPGILIVGLYGLMLIGIAGVGFIMMVLNLVLNKDKVLFPKEEIDENERVHGVKQVLTAYFTTPGTIVATLICCGIFVLYYTMH